jgi:mRNA-degrading endonuclease RelE of RelBE toxin-antitoxin system
LVFRYDLSNNLKTKIKKLSKRDCLLIDMLYKKINEIVSQTPETIEHYKNLSNRLSDRMRVHIGKSYVLTFAYYKQEQFILFWDLAHHDEIYKK